MCSKRRNYHLMSFCELCSKLVRNTSVPIPNTKNPKPTSPSLYAPLLGQALVRGSSLAARQ